MARDCQSGHYKSKSGAQRHYKLAVVTGGLFGCVVAVRTELKGLVNDNPMPLRHKPHARLPSKDKEACWPAGLKLHTAVLMNVARGETLVKVTYPRAG